MNKTIEIQIPEGKVAEWKEINGVTTLVLVDEKDNRPVTERIKTFDDACRELDKRAKSNEDIASLLADYESNKCNIKTKGTLAYMKLCIIAAALNDGWEPQFTKEEYRYYPWFYLYKQEDIDRMDEEDKENLRRFRGSSNIGAYCGLVYKDSISGYVPLCADAPALLSVKSEMLARYFGKQFIDIWSDYLIGKS